MNLLKRILLKYYTPIQKKNKFDKDGERVDINYNKEINFDKLDIYEKSHYRRYQFACSRIKKNDITGDFACGTGYGSMMLGEKCEKVIGVDLNEEVIKAIRKRYKNSKNVFFFHTNLLNIDYEKLFSVVVSFETLEHFTEEEIIKLLKIYSKALNPNGRIIISTPYLQEKDDTAIKMGHHKTFYIDELILQNWFEKVGFKIEKIYYQNYETHTISQDLDLKHFIICEAKKI